MKLKPLLKIYSAGIIFFVGLLVYPSTYADGDLAKYLPETCYQTGEFEQQKPLANTGRLLITRGHYAFACDKGLVWHTEEPLVETTLYQLNGLTWIKSADQPLQPLTGKIHQQLGKILNQLIGGNQDYLQKHFVISENNDLLQLVPRKSRMKKFLQAIDIVRSEQRVDIKLQHPDNNFTSVVISNIQNLSSLDEDQCRESTNADADVCQTLLVPGS
jgi:hypothetical protein